MSPDWSSAERRSIAYSFIRQGVAKGLSAASVLSALREEGLGYRIQTFYQDWRRETGAVQYQTLIDTLKGDTLIPRSWTPPTELNLTTKFQYVIEYTALEPKKGDTYTAYWSVSSDEQLTKDEVLSYVSLFLTTTELAEGYELEEATVQRGWHRQEVEEEW